MSSPKDLIFKKVDEYVDSLAPAIQPKIESELETFERVTIDSIESQVIDAFRSLFNQGLRNSTDGSSGLRNLNESPPDTYGSLSLPFADEIAQITRSFSNVTDAAGDDLRDIFDLTDGRGTVDASTTQSRGVQNVDSLSRGAKGFFSAAIDLVQDQLDNAQRHGGQRIELDGFLGILTDTVKDAARNPEEKARMISPDIKEQVAAKLRQQHAPLAAQFTKIALDHIKTWLRGNTSTREMGDDLKDEIGDQVKDLVKGFGGLFGKKQHGEDGSARALGHQRDPEDGSGGGISNLISDKLSTGLARVHREVRIEFRKILGGIEKELFEVLPDSFQRPLEKILGGNPFDERLDRDAGLTQQQTNRGLGDDIKAKLINKIRGLVRKVQETLRESILGVVNGGHRKFERQSWVFVQNMVEAKVQKYLPKVKISVPDDIGNEGVSVGSPSANVQLGGGNQPVPPVQAGAYLPTSTQGQVQYGQQGYQPPQGYAPQNYQPPPSHVQQPNQYAPPPQPYGSQYSGQQQGDQFQGPPQNPPYQHNYPYGQNPPY